MPSNIHAAALTDIGCVRSNNEDSFASDPTNRLYVVCDGMGGAAAGEIASSIACDAMIGAFAAQPDMLPAAARLSTAIRAANTAVFRAGRKPQHHGMGTTLVAAAVQDSELLVGNVGDSRAYIFQSDAWRQLTADHSYINELIRQGSIKTEDSQTPELQRFSSIITRAIGVAATVAPDFFSVDLHNGDVVLLASDGLTRYLDVEHFASMVDPADLEGSCRRLIEAARKLGGLDNITCILLRYDDAAPTPRRLLQEFAR